MRREQLGVKKRRGVRRGVGLVQAYNPLISGNVIKPPARFFGHFPKSQNYAGPMSPEFHRRYLYKNMRRALGIPPFQLTLQHCGESQLRLASTLDRTKIMSVPMGLGLRPRVPVPDEYLARWSDIKTEIKWEWASQAQRTPRRF